jgi:uncharacterized protein YjgD (DUF1641 family)
MAQPIAFVPTHANPKTELQRRLAAAPVEHAEALLVAYDLLDEAHRQGVLDALHGAISARDTIFSLLAKYSADPASINAIRNVLALGKILGTIDPGPMSRLSEETVQAMETHRQEEQPPSLWQLFKRMRQPETRRGLSFLTMMLAALGRATD